MKQEITKDSKKLLRPKGGLRPTHQPKKLLHTTEGF